MPPTVVILTKLPGRMPVKTRLWPALGEDGARAFYEDCLRRTIELAERLTPKVVVAYSPADAEPPAPQFVPVQGDDGATCLENALRDAYDGSPLIALGGDAPDLPFDRLTDAVEALETCDAVFVPTPDGGFSCLGLRAPVPGLAGGFKYGADDTLVSLERFLGGRGLSATRLHPWRDIDRPEDLD